MADLLATHWDGINEMNRLSKMSAPFRAFILRHVDSLMTPEQANAISKSVKTRCPPDAKSICADLALAVNDSM